MNIALKTGDTAPAQKVRLVGRDGPVSLAGADVVMQVNGREDTPFPVTVDDAATGTVIVPRGDLDTQGTRTRWQVEFQVTYANGDVQTFPEDGYLTVTVWTDLDGK
jgi:hypothetical protein